jgi:hypothetical protein
MMSSFNNSESGINDLLTELINVFEVDIDEKVLDCE